MHSEMEIRRWERVFKWVKVSRRRKEISQASSNILFVSHSPIFNLYYWAKRVCRWRCDYRLVTLSVPHDARLSDFFFFSILTYLTYDCTSYYSQATIISLTSSRNPPKKAQLQFPHHKSGVYWLQLFTLDAAIAETNQIIQQRRRSLPDSLVHCISLILYGLVHSPFCLRFVECTWINNVRKCDEVMSIHPKGGDGINFIFLSIIFTATCRRSPTPKPRKSKIL